MKRNAVPGHSLAAMVATVVAGAALCAGPARAEETTLLASAPLPEVLAQNNVLAQAKGAEKGAADKGEALPKGEGKDEGKGEDYEDDGDGHDDCREDWLSMHRVGLRFHPIGYVKERGFTLTNFVPNYPAGFPAQKYSFLPTPVFALGGGTAIGLTAMNAKLFGLRRAPLIGGNKGDHEWFVGGWVQKRLLQERGGRPAISIGIRGNRAWDDPEHDTIGAYIVGTKKIFGSPCEPQGAYLTVGGKYERYSSERALLLQTPTLIGAPVPANDDTGFRPFVGMNIALSPNFFIRGEWADNQDWEHQDMWSALGTLLVYRGIGITGGFESNGYDTRKVISFTYGTAGGYGSRGHHRRHDDNGDNGGKDDKGGEKGSEKEAAPAK